MNRLKQRIAYLVEHGGVYPDEMAALKRVGYLILILVVIDILVSALK